MAPVSGFRGALLPEPFAPHPSGRARREAVGEAAQGAVPKKLLEHRTNAEVAAAPKNVGSSSDFSIGAAFLMELRLLC